jgi:SH3-like domain-containing protein
MTILRKIWFGITALSLTTAAVAIDFKSVGMTPAVMFDAPGQKARKIYIAPPGMPVEIVLDNGDWSRVRDVSGELSWVESRQLIDQRTLIVEAPVATVRATPSDTAATVFTTVKGVVLSLAEPIVSGWIKVRHKDGEVGYIKAAEVWGE